MKTKQNLKRKQGKKLCRGTFYTLHVFVYDCIE